MPKVLGVTCRGVAHATAIRRRSRMRLNRRVLVLLLLVACALVVIPAASATAEEGSWEAFTGTFQYKGSSSFVGKSAETKFVDEANGNEFKCKEATLGGTAAASGTSNAEDRVLADIESATWNKGTETCEGTFGIKFAISQTASSTKPWPLHILWRLVANPKHHFLGLLPSVHFIVKGTECEVEVNGKTPVLLLTGTAAPWIDFKFGKEVNKNTVGAENTLAMTVLKESGLFGCGGSKTGDRLYFEGIYEETSGPEEPTLE
jgi:hypothetical protein